jgi:ribokinase
MGYLSLDRVTQADGTSREQPGGAALYAALGARAAGAEVELLVAIGGDWPAAWLQEMVRHGIGIAACERRDGPTRRARIAHARGGTRHSAHHDDALWWERTQALAPPMPPLLAPDDVLLLAPMPPRHAMAALDAAGPVRAVADTSEAFLRQDPAALRALLPRLSVFAPSREETDVLGEASGCAVVEKRGADGLFLHDPPQRFAPPPVVVLDTTGAGDATVGAIAAGLAAGRSLAATLPSAVAIGARCVTGHGPSALGFVA